MVGDAPKRLQSHARHLRIDFAELIESSIDRKRIDETDYRVLFKAAQTPNIRWYI